MIWQTKNKWYNIKPIKEAVASPLLESDDTKLLPFINKLEK